MDNLTVCYKKNSNIVSRKIAGESILVPIRQKMADLDSIYALDEVAGLIWDLIDGKRSLDGILENILLTYDVNTQTAKEDLFSFTRVLVKIEAIEELNA